MGADGEKEIVVYAVDRAKNLSSSTVMVLLERTPPVIGSVWEGLEKDIDGIPVDSAQYPVRWERAVSLSEIEFYEVFESLNGSEWTKVGTTTDEEMVVDHIDGKCGDRYVYKVVAVNRTGLSGSSTSDGILLVEKAEVIGPKDGDGFYSVVHISKDMKRTVVKIPYSAFSQLVTIVIWESEKEGAMEGSVREICALNEDNKEVQPDSAIFITLPYIDPNPNDEMADYDYAIFRFEGGEWRMVEDEVEGFQIVDPENNSVSVWTSHLSLFGVIGKPARPTSFVPEHIWPYPNPYKRVRDDGLRFVGLPGVCRLRVWTVSGKLVFDEEISPDMNGEYLFKDADSLPSGIYIWLIEKDGECAKGKIGIIR